MELAAFLIILAFLAHTLRDKCLFHTETFKWTQKWVFLRPNWKNRYIWDTGKIVKVKWWMDVFPFMIDGPHLFGDLTLLFFCNAVYFTNPGIWFGWVEFMAAFVGVRMIEHYVIMHGKKK